MDNHPPTRRPHKSPAHTVKDRRNRPQRLAPFPVAPKCPREPHIIQAFRRTSTPDEEKIFRSESRFSVSNRPEKASFPSRSRRAAHYARSQESFNRFVEIFFR